MTITESFNNAIFGIINNSPWKIYKNSLYNSCKLLDHGIHSWHFIIIFIHIFMLKFTNRGIKFFNSGFSFSIRNTGKL